MKKIKLKVMGYTKEKALNLDIIRNLSDRYEFEIVDDPDYVITFSAIPDFLEYDCIRIQIIGENIRPDFNVCDYAVGFDNILFDDRYIRWPLYREYDDFSLACKKHILDSKIDYLHRKFCNMVVSNGGDVDGFSVNFLKIYT